VNRLLQPGRQHEEFQGEEPAAHGRNQVVDIHAIAPVGQPDDILHQRAPESRYRTLRHGFWTCAASIYMDYCR
jgi:hypothetical protein